MTTVRVLAVTGLVMVAVTLQLGVLPTLVLTDVVPNLVLVVVIAMAMSRGPEFGALVGFAAGLALDLAPPADHTAGRWALAFVVVGYLVGMARRDVRTSVLATVVLVAAGSFIGTSLFALSGLVLGDQGVTVGGVAHVVPLALLYDVLLTPLVVPLVLAMMRRLEPAVARL
ncbi:MAG: rod shape-determining protein MreD [Propionibacteriales bacterium]|nr:rod shape-determining protein MreD [Propionibacteriales bacterium]